MRSVLVVLGLAGCWTSSSPSQPLAEAPEPEPVAHAKAVPGPLPARTIWRGRYECTQGWTAMQLSLDIAEDGRAIGIFDFGALADNPAVPSGSYRLVGRVTESPDRTDLTLSPERWLSQPDGYEMVALTGHTDKKRSQIRGRIEHVGCGAIELDRVDP